MTKAAALRALQSLEGLAVVNWEATAREKEQAKADARRVRRFLNSQRQQISLLRRYVAFGASKLEEFGVDPSEIMEMRDVAKPKVAR